MTEKDKKIIEDAEKHGTPIFVLVAKDSAAIRAMDAYFFECMKQKCTVDHVTGVRLRIEEFTKWQEDNCIIVKKPD